VSGFADDMPHKKIPASNDAGILTALRPFLHSLHLAAVFYYIRQKSTSSTILTDKVLS
jgi:hypothetical protein